MVPSPVRGGLEAASASVSTNTEEDGTTEATTLTEVLVGARDTGSGRTCKETRS